MIIFFIIIICLIIATVSGYTIYLSKEDDIHKTGFCVVIIIILTTIIVSVVDKEVEEKDIINILNGDIKYDTISMDKHGKLLEIEIIK